MDFVGGGGGVGTGLGIDLDPSGLTAASRAATQSTSSSLFASNHHHAAASAAAAAVHQAASSAAAAGMAAAAAATTGNGGMGAENNPILYNEPNRTSAIDDIRSGVIYIFIITIFLCFFLILPGIRNDKFPTFLCITSSLIVTSIILISLFGTTWHVAEAPISAAYRAFSRDRIQGDLNVKIGLQSVNITLRARRYYILHETRGPMIMFDPSESMQQQQQEGEASKFIRSSADSSAELVDSVEEVFGDRSTRVARASSSNATSREKNSKRQAKKRDTMSVGGQKYTIKRVNVDINYNERFYWIGPSQMAHEHHKALERGLPYPILTVVEYLSQDDGGFNWSRQYRSAGYYTYIILWLSLCVCVLMFFLHCAAPRYGIYTMQILGCLLLFANLTYATLVPRGEQKLVIPFEGQSLRFRFGWSFWLVLLGGCLSLLVGTIIVIIDYLFPNFILTTVLDVDYDLHHRYYKHKRKQKHGIITRPPPFVEQQQQAASSSNASSTSKNSALSLEFSDQNQQQAKTTTTTKTTSDISSSDSRTARHRFGRGSLSPLVGNKSSGGNNKQTITPLSALFAINQVDTLVERAGKRPPAVEQSVVEMHDDDDGGDSPVRRKNSLRRKEADSYDTVRL